MSSTPEMLSLERQVDERLRVSRVNRLVLLVCLMGAGSLITLAGWLFLPQIQKERVELQLIMDPQKYGSIPPSVSLPAPLLSTFRGLMVNFLWPRAEELKNNGQFYELQQLYTWVCDLLPRFPTVWGNAAWNMAYNISVGTYDERERWHWVYSGVTLLRDKGIPLNPRTADLYKELAWIFLHKMGDFLDDHHLAYKRNWAVMLERVLGEPPPEPDAQQVVDAFGVIREAAERISTLGALHSPETLATYLQQDPEGYGLPEFVSRLRSIGLEPDAAFLELVAREMRHGLKRSDLLVRSGSMDTNQTAEAFTQLMKDEKLAVARDQTLAAVRAHVLAKDYRLDPVKMHELMKQYGPCDWRTVYAQGLYWAAEGVREESRQTIGKDENIEMNTVRFKQFAIKDMAERGQLILEPDFDDPFKSYIQMLPSYSLYADKLHQYYLEAAEEVRGDEDPREYYAPGPAGRLYKDGHVNFLHDAVRMLYLEGRVEQAQKYYTYLYENYLEPDGVTRKAIYQQPLERFATADLFADMDSYKKGTALINSLMNYSYQTLAFDRPVEAAMKMKLARDGYDKYMKDKQIDRTERRQLPPFEYMQAVAFEAFIKYSPIPLQRKGNAWQKLMVVRPRICLDVYKRLQLVFVELCAAEQPDPFDPLTTFPPPEGWEKYQLEWNEEATRNWEKDTQLEGVDIDQGNKR
ncbi:MAG: hypothetical protein HJJLKODD_01800 [Phycisphaerae bacterium]|nr:hypothetical protein [Phycisphaerae bacterium]